MEDSDRVFNLHFRLTICAFNNYLLSVTNKVIHVVKKIFDYWSAPPGILSIW